MIYGKKLFSINENNKQNKRFDIILIIKDKGANYIKIKSFDEKV